MGQTSRRILHIFGQLERGGAELRTLDVMRCVDRRRFQLEFCALSGMPGSLDSEVVALGGQVHHVKLNREFPQRFIRLIKHRQIQVVHSHVHYSSGLILFLAKLAGVTRRIAHFRTTGDGKVRTWSRRRQSSLMRLLLQFSATDIVGVNQAVLDFSWPHWQDDSRCKVIYNGVGVPKCLSRTAARREILDQLGLSNKNQLFVHVGRMVPAKNHQRLIEIFSAIKDLRPDSHLLLVGRATGVIKDMVNAKVREHDLGSSVVSLGERTDIHRILSAADLMLFPSIREGLPGAVLEACTVGTPVLGSNIPGIEEIAAYIPSVRCIPLSSGNVQWAKCAISMVSDLQVRQDSERIAREFSKGMFGLNRCVLEFERLWGV